MNNNQLRSSTRSLYRRILSVLLVLCCWGMQFPANTTMVAAFAKADIDPRIETNLHSKTRFLLVFRGPSVLQGADLSDLAKQQQVFLDWLNYRNIQHELQSTMTHTLNGLVIQLNNTDVPQICDYPTLKMILPYQSDLKPARGFALSHIYPQMEKPSNPWTGKGIRVGIVDSGINTQHPELIGRVIGGKNFARPEGSFEDYGFHGTFVAGVTGGRGKDPFLKGVAPEVEFMSYVVFKDYRSPSVSILPALDQAVKDQCKIVLLSLGGISTDYNPEKELLQESLSLMKKADIAVITAAGNMGMPYKNNPSIFLPGSSPEVLTVGASDDRKWLSLELENLQKEKKHLQAQMASPGLIFSSDLNTSAFIEAGYGTSHDFNEARKNLNDPTKPFIALVHRGPKNNPITFYEKMVNAMKAGAKAILFVNYSNGDFIRPNLTQERMEIDWFKTYIPSAMLSYKEAGDLLDNPELWKLISASTHSVPTVDSSCGPVSDSVLKPDLMAPGSEIFSLINLGYGWMSGSSVSAAFVAGSVACIMQAHPDWTVDQIYSSLVHTCNPLINPLSHNPLPFEMQGAGELRLDRALQSNLHLAPLAIKARYEDQALHRKIIISNSSDQAVTEKLNAVFILRDPLQKQFCNITFHPEQVNIPARGEAEIKIIFELETSFHSEVCCEGWIKLADLSLPFVIELAAKNISNAPIQNFTINTNRWDFSDNTSFLPIEASFQVKKGKHIRFRSNLNFYLIPAEIDMVLLDKQGLNWGTCFSSRECFPDRYHLNLSSLFIDRSSLPPEGSYFLMLRYWAVDLNGRGSYVQYKEALPIEVIYSPDPATDISWRAFQKQTVQQKFTIALIPSREVTLRKFIVECRFDPKKLTCQSIEILALRSLSGCKPELTRIGSNADGLIYAEWSCPEGKELTIPKGHPLLEFGFVGLSTGKVDIHVTKLYGIDENDQAMTFRFPGFTCHLYDSAFLRGDLNDDGVVDSLDWQIMSASYGSFYLDASYDYRADINNDAWINLLDLSCLAEES